MAYGVRDNSKQHPQRGAHPAGGPLPNDQFLESPVQNSKVGGTVSSAVAHELDDSTTPATLVAKNILGGEYGQQEFSLAS